MQFWSPSDYRIERPLSYCNSLTVLYLFCILSIFTSCSQKEEYLAEEITPEYVDPATMKLADFRDAGNLESYQRYLDSVYALYVNRSVKDKFYVWYLCADSYGRIGKNDLSLAYTDSIIQLLDNNPPSNFARNNYLWAYYYKADKELRLKHYDAAYRYYYRALSMAEKHKDTCAIGYYHLKIGLIMFDTRQYRDASQYFVRAYNSCLTCDNNFGYFYRTQELLNDMGLCYERTAQYDSAIIYYKKGIELLENNESLFPKNRQGLMQIAVSIVKGNLGGTYAKAGMLDSAEKVLTESLSYDRYPVGEPIDAQFTRLKLAEVYIASGRLADAKELLDKIKLIDNKLPDNNVKIRLSRVCWLYWDKKGDDNKAYQYLKLYKTQEDSVKKNEISFSLASVDNNVKNIGNEYKIAVLEETANQRKMYLVALIIIALFAVVIIFLVINNLRRSRVHVNKLRAMNDRINVQRKQLEVALKDLENATNEKDRILKAVSHDMRSPINSALALIDILTSQSDNLDEDQKEYVGLIKKSNENALGLTKDLLEVATLNTEQLEKAPVDITTVMGDRVKLLKYKAAEKGQELKFSSPADHITATVNEEKILRILSNLVTNAIKFSSIGGVIDISLEQGGDSFTLKVKDNGIGIPEKMKGHVFELFSEAKRFGTSGEQPFGLGLSISKQIVEVHNGKIWFESEEGKGTTFFVEIPL